MQCSNCFTSLFFSPFPVSYGSAWEQLQARCLICAVALTGLSLYAILRVRFQFPNVKSQTQGIVSQ